MWHSCSIEYSRTTTALVCMWTKGVWVVTSINSSLPTSSSPPPWLLTPCCMHVPLCGVRKSGAEADTQTVRYDVLLVTSNPCANVIPCYRVSLTSLWCISMQCRGDEAEISICSSFFFRRSLISTGVLAGFTGPQVFHFAAQLFGSIQGQDCSFGNLLKVFFQRSTYRSQNNAENN